MSPALHLCVEVSDPTVLHGSPGEHNIFADGTDIFVDRYGGAPCRSRSVTLMGRSSWKGMSWSATTMSLVARLSTSDVLMVSGSGSRYLEIHRCLHEGDTHVGQLHAHGSIKIEGPFIPRMDVRVLSAGVIAVHCSKRGEPDSVRFVTVLPHDDTDSDPTRIYMRISEPMRLYGKAEPAFQRLTDCDDGEGGTIVRSWFQTGATLCLTEYRTRI